MLCAALARVTLLVLRWLRAVRGGVGSMPSCVKHRGEASSVARDGSDCRGGEHKIMRAQETTSSITNCERSAKHVSLTHDKKERLLLTKASRWVQKNQRVQAIARVG